jgi:stearoyl-CoA desaturase (delta-9 desaturase)
MNDQPTSRTFFQSLKYWFSAPTDTNVKNDTSERIDWVRTIPFLALHVGCVAVFFVGFSWLALSVAVFLYALRVFTLTAFYHRYFSHRSFKTWRIVQFFFAFIGCTSIQRGPLWWAAHHRHHHTHSDDPEDLHSPRQKGILFSHMVWFLTPRAQFTNVRLIPDFAKYPEIRFLDRFDLLPPALLSLFLYGFGELVAWGMPEAGVTGLQLLVWGMLLSTIAVYHVTYLVNSATHLIVALLTFGEGWHNNHHYYPNSTRQGFFWWEIDISYYILSFMQMLGLVWDLKGVPQRILEPKPKVKPALDPVPAEAEPASVLAP